MGGVDLERGRSVLESSTARATNDSRGMLTLRTLCILSCTSLTALNEMETAISVSGSGSLRVSEDTGVGGGVAGFDGAAILMVLRSR